MVKDPLWRNWLCRDGLSRLRQRGLSWLCRWGRTPSLSLTAVPSPLYAAMRFGNTTEDPEKPCLGVELSSNPRKGGTPALPAPKASPSGASEVRRCHRPRAPREIRPEDKERSWRASLFCRKATPSAQTSEMFAHRRSDPPCPAIVGARAFSPAPSMTTIAAERYQRSSRPRSSGFGLPFHVDCEERGKHQEPSGLQSFRKIFASSAAATNALRAAGGWLSPRNTRKHASIACLRFSV